MIAKLIITLSSLAFVFINSQDTYAKKDVSDVYNIYTTQAFFIPIISDIFDKAFPSGAEIEYMTSILGMPDLPVWMHYRHPNGSTRAYLYGSPAVADDQDIEIEVIAINRYNYNTHKDVLKFRVINRERKAKFEVELKFVNYNIDDMFESNRFEDVLLIFREKLWKDSTDIYITKIASPLDVGGRLPLDPKEKEGVIIRIGSTDNYTRDILDLEREVERIKNRNPCPRKYKATSAEYMFRNKGFYSDWCSFQLIRHSIEQHIPIPEPKPNTSLSITGDDELDINYMSIRHAFPRRDYTFDIMLCFLVPLIIGTTIISSLTFIFFYSKEEPNKACNETPVQLEQYNSISRATLKLRSLSLNRNHSVPDFTIPLLSPNVIKNMSSSSTLPRIHSTRPSISVRRASSLRHSTAFEPNS